MSITGILNGPAISLAAYCAAFAPAGCCTQPFFQRFTGDQYFIGLQRVLFETLKIDGFFNQNRCNTIGRE